MKPPETGDPNDRTRNAPRRKAYEKPRLERYGDLTEIAQSLANQTNNDGAAHPNKHFTN